MLTKAELKTLLYLIDCAADQLSNNGCNDLRLLADCKLTREEAQSIRELEHAYCDDKECDAPVRVGARHFTVPQVVLGERAGVERPPDDAQKEVYATDWIVLRALIEKLKVIHGGAP